MACCAARLSSAPEASAVGRVFDWYKKLLHDGYKGDTAFLKYRHLVQIAYTNRARARRTEYLEIDDFGAKYATKADWDSADALRAAGFAKGYLLDFGNPHIRIDDAIGRALSAQ